MAGRGVQPTEYIWMNGEFVRWEEAKIHVLTHTLHYGGGAFEGIRAYASPRGPAIFRLREHLERLVYSSGALRMELPYSVDEMIGAVVDLIRMNGLPDGYIRPIAYYGSGVIGLNPTGAPVDIAIACWPWGKYLPFEAVDIKTSKYIRIHPRSTISDAKICGHYVNSILAVQELQGTKYHEALFLDVEGYVAEGPGENIFIVNGEQIATPRLGTILAGITRNTVIEIAKSEGYKVVERNVSLGECYEADEAFFTGTAAEVCPIRSIDDHPIGAGGVGKITAKIQRAYQEIVTGKNPKYDRYLTIVEPQRAERAGTEAETPAQ